MFFDHVYVVTQSSRFQFAHSVKKMSCMTEAATAPLQIEGACLQFNGNLTASSNEKFLISFTELLLISFQARRWTEINR